jgi:hypothetical protein
MYCSYRFYNFFKVMAGKPGIFNATATAAQPTNGFDVVLATRVQN